MEGWLREGSPPAWVLTCVRHAYILSVGHRHPLILLLVIMRCVQHPSPQVDIPSARLTGFHIDPARTQQQQPATGAGPADNEVGERLPCVLRLAPCTCCQVSHPALLRSALLCISAFFWTSGLFFFWTRHCLAIRVSLGVATLP